MSFNPEILYNGWVWLAAVIVSFGLCTYLPILIKDDALRHRVNWLVLIPVSIFIIAYIYPAGIEVFRRLAVLSK